MNPQQRHLKELLDIAKDDLFAGRPAQGVSFALMTALRAEPYDDLDQGEDDQLWREIRGAG